MRRGSSVDRYSARSRLIESGDSGSDDLNDEPSFSKDQRRRGYDFSENQIEQLQQQQPKRILSNESRRETGRRRQRLRPLSTGSTLNPKLPYLMTFDRPKNREQNLGRTSRDRSLDSRVALNEQHLLRQAADSDSDDDDDDDEANLTTSFATALRKTKPCFPRNSYPQITGYDLSGLKTGHHHQPGQQQQATPSFWPTNYCRCNVEPIVPLQSAQLCLLPGNLSNHSASCDLHITTTHQTFYPSFQCIEQQNQHHQQQQQESTSYFVSKDEPSSDEETIDLQSEKLLDNVIKVLNSEKESLVFQVNMMNNQIEAQNERIKELEGNLALLNSRLSARDAIDERNLCSKVVLEETRRQLCSEIAKLKTESNLNNIEKERLTVLESECSTLKAALLEREAETGLLRLALAKLAKNTGYTLSDTELQLLRGVVSAESLLKVGHNLVTPLIQNKSERDCRLRDKPPLAPRSHSYSAPIRNNEECPEDMINKSYSDYEKVNNISSSSLLSSSSSSTIPKFRGRSASPATRPSQNSNSESDPNEWTGRPSRSWHVYSTMPRAYGAQVYQRLHQQQQQQKGSMNGGWSDTLTDGPRPRPLSYSPNSGSGSKFSIVTFAQEDQIIPGFGGRSNPDIYKSSNGSVIIGNSQNNKEKSKGIKKLFSIRLKKNDSNQVTNGFVRGGVRSTAGPRLIAGERRKIEVNLPFSRLDNILVAQWLSMIGLGMYSESCRRWVVSGESLIHATDSELEKELGMKNKLHRKKLRLALSLVNNEADLLTREAHKLDYLWIARWLDDIGLPQYKENFINGRVDGSVLHKLTVQDLIHLNINSKVHYCSLKQGIKLLRDNSFSPECLKRRATCDEINQVEWSTDEIARWTSHRVMEWLRSIDLSEYTPNLRGSGVHGALIIYEPSFDADLLSGLLSIPCSRTLLRRYISTHFNKLIGQDLVKLKRDYLSKNPIITPSSKILVKSSKFSIIKKRSKCYYLLDDLVCPITSTSTPTTATSTVTTTKLSDTTTTDNTNENEDNSSSNSFNQIQSDSPLITSKSYSPNESEV